MGDQVAAPELREVDKQPFGLYAVIALLLLAALSAAFDIIRIQIGLPSRLLQQIAEVLQDLSSLGGITKLLVSDERILIIINSAIILLIVVAAIGLWFRDRAAWILAMILIGVGLGYNIWAYIEHTPVYISMATHVLAVFYLNERSVRLIFERKAPATGGTS